MNLKFKYSGKLAKSLTLFIGENSPEAGIGLVLVMQYAVRAIKVLQELERLIYVRFP